MAKLLDKVADPAIPTLATVLDAAELSRQLSYALPHGQWDASQEIRLRVLRWHKASRCTFEIMLPTSRGPQELIGKVYAQDRSDIYWAMEEIRQAGFNGEHEFSIARPVAYLAPLHLLLYEKVPGIRAKSLIVDANASDRPAAVERCAHWLARFHARAPRSGPAFHVGDCLSAMAGWLIHLAKTDSPFASKAWQLFAQLKTAAPGHNSVEMCAGHGTYTVGQLIFNKGQTFVIDWDTFNLADPSHDLARFLVDLERMALKYFGSIRALDWAVEVFLTTYTAAGGCYLATHLSFETAAICLERAKRDVEKQSRGWQERAEMMLDEGLRILDATPNGKQ